MAVVNINRNQFEEMVHSGNAVLVEFSAPWCVYCVNAKMDLSHFG